MQIFSCKNPIRPSSAGWYSNLLSKLAYDLTDLITDHRERERETQSDSFVNYLMCIFFGLPQLNWS